MTTDIPPDDDPRSLRLAHLRDESNIKSVGQLCYLVAFFSVLGTLEFLAFALGWLRFDPPMPEIAGPDQLRVLFGVFAVFLLVNAVFQAALGYGLTRLLTWARWTVVAITGLSLASHVGLSLALCFTHPAWGLPSLVVGGAIHAIILYPLLTTAAGVVFSRSYRAIIRETPEIRGRMHWLLKLFIALILGGVAGFVAYLLALYLRIVD